jgi:hypothetical protein
MSLSAKSATRTKTAIRDRYNNAEATQDIQDFLNGCYELELPSSLSEDELKLRALVRWMRNRADVIHKASLSEAGKLENVDLHWRGVSFDSALMRYVAASCYYDNERILPTRLFPHSLINLGVDTPTKGNRFMDLYLKVYDPTRSWVSGKQVNQSRVAAITLTPNYNRLPDWVREGLMKAPESAKIGGDRIGNIWRLIPCVKAWKWCSELPKGVAEIVGKLSPRMRMLSAWSWAVRDTWDESEKRRLSQSEQVASFWKILHHLQGCTTGSILRWMWLEDGNYIGGKVEWGRTKWAAFLTESLGLPWGLIELPKEVTYEDIENAIVEYGTPQQVCQALFGCSGKATVKAFLSSDKTRWQWAQALGESNPDAVQKILQLESCIAYQADAIDFLKSLPMQSRIRLLGATTFKYRGQVNPISDDHVRDTGYLWSNIQEKPELGRIRCWFSVHEELSAAFVKELPDEELPVAVGWERVDGLCAVDGSWSLELPKRVATLKYYGETFRKCVGGYGPAIKQKRSIIFVVREQGFLTHCVEVEGYEVNQFYQAGNSSPSNVIEESVCAALRQAQLID